MSNAILLSDVGPEPLELSVLLAGRPPGRWPRGSLVYGDGAVADRLYVVASGLVRLSRAAQDGRQVTLALLDAGMVFGHEALVEEARHVGCAQALVDSEIHALGRAEAARLLAAPEAGRLLLAALAERLSAAEDQLASLALRGVTARLAAKLLELADRYGKVTRAGVRIDARFTHQQLSELIGTSRETLTKALNDLRSSGFVEVHERRLHLRDQAALARLAAAR